MRNPVGRWLAVAGVLAACSGSSGSSDQETVPPPATDDTRATPTPADDTPPPAAAETRTLDADETVALVSGATFTVSKGWTLEKWPDRVVLTAPEGDLAFAYVVVTADDRAAAVAQAWRIWKASFDLAVAQEVDLPARDGWDAVARVVYVTPVEEKRGVLAFARRKGDSWYVALVDGAQAALGRRSAQLGTAVESLKVAGVEEESFAGRTANALDAERLAELETFIEEARVATKVPGAAIAIVQGGKIVYEKGFGVRQLGKKAKVTPKTLFMIGSVGKSLTTMMTARLVEAGELTWDSPVVEVLPSFGLGDEATTKATTMRHTACACTGMPRQDFEMIFEGDVSAEERLESMKSMTPTTGFGETFQYSNLMVSAGGFAAAHAYAPKKKLGAAYDAAMKALVFKPLGMKSTTFDFKRVKRSNHAWPHSRDLRGEPHAEPVEAERWVLPVRPAGGAWSSVHDMARVLLLELGRGKLDGKQVIGEEYLLARREPQVKIDDDISYGLGLVVGNVHEIPIVSHTGGTGGFTTLFTFWPDHDVGMIIVANSTGAGLFNGSVQRRLVELLFDGRVEAAENMKLGLERIEKQRAEQLARIDFEPDAEWLREFTGTWAAPGLGTIAITVDKKGEATLDAGEWKVAVGRYTELDGTVQLITTGGMLAGLTFIPRDRDGRQVLVFSDGQHEYLFEREK